MNIVLPEKQNHLVPGASVKAMAIIRGFSQEREGKTVACKNEDVCPLRCSASSIYRLQLHFHIEV